MESQSEVIDLKNFKEVKLIFETAEPNEIAESLNNNKETLSEDTLIVEKLFTIVPLEKQVRIFEHLDYEIQLIVLDHFPPIHVSQILNELPPDDRTQLFSKAPKELVGKWLSLLSIRERKDALKLLQYPEDSIGRLMTTDFIAVNPNWTCEKSIQFIRDYGLNSETINFLYVVDDKNKLIDDLKIREVLLADPSTTIREICDTRFSSLDANSDQETAIKVFKETDRYALPVTDYDGILLGIVTIDDLLDIIEREDTEDIQKLGGSEALEDPYFSTKLNLLIRKRAGWLIVLFIGEMLTATAMSFFEDEIAKAVVLALFIPLIISSGGNSGSQAATIITRALAIGEVKLTDWLKVFKRELISGIALGATLGIIGLLRVVVWSFFFNTYGEHSFLLGLTIGLTLLGIVLWGTITGSMLPIILKKLGFDPAVSSAPFVATIVDVTGIVIYFSLAFLILKGTLL